LLPSSFLMARPGIEIVDGELARFVDERDGHLDAVHVDFERVGRCRCRAEVAASGSRPGRLAAVVAFLRRRFLGVRGFGLRGRLRLAGEEVGLGNHVIRARA